MLFKKNEMHLDNAKNQIRLFFVETYINGTNGVSV